MNKDKAIDNYIDNYIERFENKLIQFDCETIKNRIHATENKKPIRSVPKEKDTSSSSNEEIEAEIDQNTSLNSEDTGLSISEKAFIKFFFKRLISKGLRRYIKAEKPQTLEEVYELLRDLCETTDKDTDDKKSNQDSDEEIETQKKAHQKQKIKGCQK